MKYILSKYKMQCKVFLSSWWCLLWANFHNKLYWFLSSTGTLPHWLTIFLHSSGRRPISEDLQCARYEWWEHRGYHMATQRYEISHQVLKNISRVSTANEWNTFQHEKSNFLSLSDRVMFYLLYQHQWNNKPFDFCSERPNLLCYCSNAIFSHVKITCYFQVCRYHVLEWKLTWYSLVFV